MSQVCIILSPLSRMPPFWDLNSHQNPTQFCQWIFSSFLQLNMSSYFGHNNAFLFVCFSLKQLSFSVLNHANLSICCISPLDCKLLEGREVVGFCHFCSTLYVIDTSYMVGSETHYNIEENGYNWHSYFSWP